MGKGIQCRSSGWMNPRGAAAPGVCLWSASNEMLVSEIVLLTKSKGHRKWNEQVWLVGTRKRNKWCRANRSIFFFPPNAIEGTLHQVLCSGMQSWCRYQTVPGAVSYSFEMQTSWGRANRDPARLLDGFSSALNTGFFHLRKAEKKAKFMERALSFGKEILAQSRSG